MKTAILYCSKHGTTEKVARKAAGLLEGEVDILPLSKKSTTDLSIYDTIILGTSIYAGQPSETMTRFCEEKRSKLENKRIGLFICGMNKMNFEKELNTAFPMYLQQRALAKAALGGEFLFDRMNFLERFIVKRIAKKNSSVSEIDEEKIKEFTDRMRKENEK